MEKSTREKVSSAQYTPEQIEMIYRDIPESLRRFVTIGEAFDIRAGLAELQDIDGNPAKPDTPFAYVVYKDASGPDHLQKMIMQKDMEEIHGSNTNRLSPDIEAESGEESGEGEVTPKTLF